MDNNASSETTGVVRFDTAMNMARNILAREVSVSPRKIKAAQSFSLISEFIEKETLHFKSPIIQILSAYDGENVDTISLDLALILSEKYGKKVLFVDSCATTSSKLLNELRAESEVSINDLCSGNAEKSTPFLNIERKTFFYAPLISTNGENNKLADITSLKKFLMTARANFDYVVIGSERSIKTNYPFSLASIAQLNILVVAAGKTRKPVVDHIIKSMNDMGSKLSATILSNRSYYIPRFLYNFLFSGGE